MTITETSELPEGHELIVLTGQGWGTYGSPPQGQRVAAFFESAAGPIGGWLFNDEDGNEWIAYDAAPDRLWAAKRWAAE